MLGYAYTLAVARGVMALQQQHRHRIADDCNEYCSVTTNIMGIKFYHGVVRMSSMMHVYLERETHNQFDHNSIRVVLKSGEMLGHLERKVADVLAPLMDLRIAIKTYVSQFDSSPYGHSTLFVYTEHVYQARSSASIRVAGLTSIGLQMS